MFREHARLFTIIQFCTDIVLTILAFPVAYATRLHLDRVVPEPVGRLLNPELLSLQSYAWLVLIGIIWWMIVARTLGLYRITIKRSGWEKLGIVVASAFLLGLFLGFLSFALKLDMSRPLIALFVFYQAVFLCGARAAVALQSRSRSHPSRDRRNILIVGTSRKAHEMGELISRYSDWGLRILGYVGLDHVRGGEGTQDVMGAIADIPTIIEENVVDEIIFVGSEPRDLEGLDDVLAICKEQGVKTRVAADFFPVKVSHVSMEFLENVPIITFSATPDHAVALLVKRLIDVLGASFALVLSSPLMLILAALVKLTSRGPAIYRQVRSGLYGRRFVLYKFRSMCEGAEDVLWEIKHLNEMDGPVFKMRDDPRVTPLGHILRKSSLDEWPQFWNVLKGDMSLVGPRAPLPEEVKEYTRWQRRRLSVKPGITCLWQVSGRNEIDFQEWMKLDLFYIDNWSLLLDLKILLRTFPVVLLGKGSR
jgi:exopolysaccharide biosynthesis polyprenyl glycosylphosphotransferase